MATVEVRGRYVHGDDTPARGDVLFIPRPVAVNNTSGDVILVGAKVRATLNSQGAFTVELQPSDDPDLSPSGWTYRVVEELVGLLPRSYDIVIPVSAVSTGVDLVDVAPVVPSTGDETMFVTLAAFEALQAEVNEKQPLDADLTAIADLTTTPFGRERLTDEDAPAARSALGLGTAAVEDVSAFDAAGSAAAAQAASAARRDTIVGSSVAGNVPLTVEASASQTADLVQIKDQNGVKRVYVTAGNTLFAPQLRAQGDQVATVPMVIEGASGLTADIAKFRAAPAGPDLARIRVDGRITAPNLTELVFNVKDYGAKGDGSTSDTTSIQSAITAAVAAGGGTVYLPAGTYMINAFVGLKDKVNIRGAGPAATILKARTGLTVGVLVGAGGDTVSDFTISDLTVDGDYAGTAASLNGIQLTTAARVSVRNVEVKNVAKIGVLIQTNSADVTVDNCAINNTGLGDAANGFGVRIVQSQRCKVLNNRVIGARGMGINCGDTTTLASLDTEIDGNYIDMSSSTTYEAIGITADCLRTIIRGNHCINNMDNGISCTASECVITGNTVAGAQNSGIYLGGSNTVCTGNFVKNAGQEVSATTFGGVTIGAGQNNVVMGNRCYDDQGVKTQDYGVKESPGGDYNLISGNVLRGNLTAAVLVSGANTVNTNNVT